MIIVFLDAWNIMFYQILLLNKDIAIDRKLLRPSFSSCLRRFKMLP